jgi:hypothetical protein
MVCMGLLILGQTSQLTPSQMWVVIGLAIMGLIYSIVLRPMMRRRKDPLDRPPAFASLSQQRSVERQMQNLLVELSEMARQITAQLDTRAARLEALIKEADDKIQQLRTANNGKHERLAEPAPVAAEPPNNEDPRHSEVYTLADQGMEPHRIAAQLGRPSGEVELILALRSKA